MHEDGSLLKKAVSVLPADTHHAYSSVFLRARKADANTGGPGVFTSFGFRLRSVPHCSCRLILSPPSWKWSLARYAGDSVLGIFAGAAAYKLKGGLNLDHLGGAASWVQSVKPCKTHTAYHPSYTQHKAFVASSSRSSIFTRGCGLMSVPCSRLVWCAFKLPYIPK